MSIVGEPLSNYQKCIDVCLCCLQACHECTALCLQKPDVAQRMSYIGMMLEYTGFCQEAACLTTMNAKQVKEMYQLCAMVCEECTAGCAQFKDERCQQCVDGRCKHAVECRAM